MKIVKLCSILCLLLASSVLYAASISEDDIVGTWKVRNKSADPIYIETRGEVTFHEDGTLTIDKGAFAAAGIATGHEFGSCSQQNGPIRYQKVGRGEFYLYWDGVNHEGQAESYKKLDAVLQLVGKRVNEKRGKIRLAFIGDGGCSSKKMAGVHRVSFLRKDINANNPPEPSLACLAQLADDENACKQNFFHTGEDQQVVVPDGATYMRVKMWGAGGNRDNGANGGVGGYTTAVIPVVADDEYSVVVGRWGSNGGTENYGFGGSGGGLSGIFTGTETVTTSDQARAIMVAGGGGSSGDGRRGGTAGQSGNDPTNLTVTGDMAAACRIGRIGGGGGFDGGLISGGNCSANNSTNFGYGGSGFVAPIAEASSIESGFVQCDAVNRVPANFLDADWQRVAQSDCIGPGTDESGSDRGSAVIIEWFDSLPSL